MKKNYICKMNKTHVVGNGREVEDTKFGSDTLTIIAENPAAAAAEYERTAAAFREVPDTAEKQILNNTEDESSCWSCCYIHNGEFTQTIWHLDIAEEEK